MSGRPLTAEIAVATKKEPRPRRCDHHRSNAQIKNGNYAKVLERWGLTAEHIDQSRINPPGLPKN